MVAGAPQVVYTGMAPESGWFVRKVTPERSERLMAGLDADATAGTHDDAPEEATP